MQQNRFLERIMTATSLFTNVSDLSSSDYCVFGVATCFLRQEGETKQVEIVEPIPSSALEAILKGIPTSYRFACAKTLGEIFQGETPSLPAEFPQSASFCSDLVERAIAATRTYKTHVEAQSHISLGEIRDDFNYSTERKRVLNAANIIREEDNVKQHSHTHKVL
jgi:hypothetical protein